MTTRSKTRARQAPPVIPPPEEIYREHCRRRFVHFADHYCQVLSETAGPAADWIPFRLWPKQVEVAGQFQEHRLVVVLKARQLGLTWLALAFALWHVLLHPVATVLLFSRRDDEAVDLLDRLKGMHQHLPVWLKAPRAVVDNGHEWALPSGSRVLAFPTTAGDSYTGTLAIVDEADLVPDLDRLLRAVKPTIDAAGRLLLISRADKSRPESAFKRIYRTARAGESDWVPVFLPWNARPDRDAAWYDAQGRDVQSRTGALDDLHEQYPASEAEALSPRSLDKRIAAAWLEQCYREQAPLASLPRSAPSLPGLLVWFAPVPGRVYVIGADPAEGNPTSDESALCVLDAQSGEQVAELAGRLQPSALAAAADQIGRWYGDAPILCERNNHGHAVLLWLNQNGQCPLVLGLDGRPGWLSSQRGKALLYDRAADAFRHGEVLLHSLATFHQVASIDGSTLRAPEGERDDRADACSLALAGVGPALQHAMPEKEERDTVLYT
jgi:Terminase RNaseH-like domain/Terminase large subunit, T4likevirus-type, N-terminal